MVGNSRDDLCNDWKCKNNMPLTRLKNVELCALVKQNHKVFFKAEERWKMEGNISGFKANVLRIIDSIKWHPNLIFLLENIASKSLGAKFAQEYHAL